jgi:hypothetical protein
MEIEFNVSDAWIRVDVLISIAQQAYTTKF